MEITKELLDELGFHYYQEVWGIEDYKLRFKLGEDTECKQAQRFEAMVEFLKFSEKREDTFRYHGRQVYKVIKTVEELIQCLAEDLLEQGAASQRKEIVDFFAKIVR